MASDTKIRETRRYNLSIPNWYERAKYLVAVVTCSPGNSEVFEGGQVE